MLVSGGKIIAIDKVNTDDITISGDGIFNPLGLNTNNIHPTLDNDIFTTTSIGYIKEGQLLSAGTKLSDIWTSALSTNKNAVAGNVSFSPNNGSLFDKTENLNINNVSFNFKTYSNSITSYAVGNLNNSAICNYTGYNVNHNINSSCNLNINNNFSITCYATETNGNVISNTKSISFIMPSFYGISDNQNIVLPMGNKKIQYKPNIFSFSINYTEKFVWYAYPNSWGELKEIKDHLNFPYDNFDLKNIVYGDVNYNLYITNKIGDFNGTWYFVHQ